jgi:hypothetical protein
MAEVVPFSQQYPDAQESDASGILGDNPQNTGASWLNMLNDALQGTKTLGDIFTTAKGVLGGNASSSSNKTPAATPPTNLPPAGTTPGVATVSKYFYVIAGVAAVLALILFMRKQ